MATAPNMASAASPKMAELRRHDLFGDGAGCVPYRFTYSSARHQSRSLQHMFKDQSGGILNLFTTCFQVVPSSGFPPISSIPRNT